MKNLLNKIIYDESGINTVEIVIILAILVALAFIFKDFIMSFANGIFEKIKVNTDNNLGGL